MKSTGVEAEVGEEGPALEQQEDGKLGPLMAATQKDDTAV